MKEKRWQLTEEAEKKTVKQIFKESKIKAF